MTEDSTYIPEEDSFDANPVDDGPSIPDPDHGLPGEAEPFPPDDDQDPDDDDDDDLGDDDDPEEIDDNEDDEVFEGRDIDGDGEPDPPMVEVQVVAPEALGGPPSE